MRQNGEQDAVMEIVFPDGVFMLVDVLQTEYQW